LQFLKEQVKYVNEGPNTAVAATAATAGTVDPAKDVQRSQEETK
jgi:hypothetical protein